MINKCLDIKICLMKPRFYVKYLDEFYDFQEKLNINGFTHTSRLHMVIVLEIALVSFDQNKEVSFEYLYEKNPKKKAKGLLYNLF